MKTIRRLRLTDDNANAFLELNITTYKPDFNVFNKTMKHEKSHSEHEGFMIIWFDELQISSVYEQ